MYTYVYMHIHIYIYIHIHIIQVLLAEIRGVPKHLVQRVVERAVTDMSLSEKAGTVSKSYSGGNKRKLSVAMSIVANPKVTFLDEVDI